MVKHIVMWNIQENKDKEEVFNTFKEMLESLKDTIPSLRYLEVGKNFNDSPAGHDISLYSEFDDQAGLDAYQIHPEHIKVSSYGKTVLCDRRICDYFHDQD